MKKRKDSVLKKFDDFAEKFGTVEWDGVELAITQDPYPFGPFEDWFFTATAMDKDGNLWETIWYPRPDADEFDDYSDQVEDWDEPDSAEMVEEGYYLD